MYKKIRLIFNNVGFVKYFKNTSWLLAERVLRLILGVTVGVWVARYLGPTNFGLFIYAQSIVSFFTIIASFGLEGILIRELVKNKKRKEKLIGTAFWLKLMGAILVLILLSLFLNFISNDKTINLLIFILASTTIFQSFNVIDFYFKSKVLSKYVVYANSIMLFISSIVKIVFILNKASLVYFAWIVLFDSVILALGLIYFFIKENKHFYLEKFKFHRETAITLLKDSWPLIISGGALMIQARIDQVMIKIMIGSIEVGYYSVALRIIEIFGFFPVILGSTLLPAIVKAKIKSEQLYQERLLNYYRLSFLMFLVVSFPIFLFAEDIISLLYGEAYKPAGILLSFMAIRLFFTNTGVARSAFINNENLFKFSLFTMVIGAFVNIFLNYLMIPVLGSKGAIVATIFSFSVTIFLIDLMFLKTRNNTKLQLKGIITFYKCNYKNNN